MSDNYVSCGLRECQCKGQTAIFHKWSEKAWLVPPSGMRGGHNGGLLQQTFAIVEFAETGKVEEVLPYEIVFDDSVVIYIRPDKTYDKVSKDGEVIHIRKPNLKGGNQMKTITGECRYCEQLQTVAIDDLEESAELTREQIEEVIAKNCMCEEAIEYQTKLCNIQKAKEIINRLAGTHWTKDYLNETIDLIMDGHYGSITISIDAVTTVYIKKKPDGSLSVKRKDVDIEEEII